METVKVMESAAAKEIPVDEVRGLRQKMWAICARISYREKVLKRLRTHSANGTYPNGFKTFQHYPKFENPESQTLVNQVCDQTRSDILNIMIQEQEKKQAVDKESLTSCRKRKCTLKEVKPSKISKKKREAKTLTIGIS